MIIETKIDRIKTEIKFLVEGVGTLEEKQAALQQIGTFTEELLAIETAKQAAQ